MEGQMKFPGRPTTDDVPPEKRFDIDALYEIEHNQIYDLLKATANEAVGDRRTTKEQALKESPVVIDGFINYYGRIDPKLDRELFSAAKKNKLKEVAPSLGTIAVYKYLTIFMLTAEVLFGFVFIFYARNFNIIPILVAAGLAIGAYFSGVGISNIAIAVHPFLEKDLDRNPPRPSTAGILKGIGGLAAICAFTYVRIADEQDAADIFVIILISLGIALVAVMCGAVWHYLRAKYDYLLKKMSICQKWQATERHASGRDHMEAFYKMQIERLLPGP